MEGEIAPPSGLRATSHCKPRMLGAHQKMQNTKVGLCGWGRPPGLDSPGRRLCKWPRPPAPRGGGSRAEETCLFPLMGRAIPMMVLQRDTSSARVTHLIVRQVTLCAASFKDCRVRRNEAGAYITGGKLLCEKTSPVFLPCLLLLYKPTIQKFLKAGGEKHSIQISSKLVFVNMYDIPVRI